MKRHLYATFLLLALGGFLALSGCAGTSRYATPHPPLTPTQPYTEPEERYSNPGSLYSASESLDLYADNRARRVGDIVQIKVVENAKSKSKADTTANKKSSQSFGVAAAFRRNTIGVIPGMGGPLTGEIGVDPMLSTSTSSDLSATGETKRENYVTATVGARVIRVLPGGMLQLLGERSIRVNDETQHMVISGIVRLQDIASDNTVESTQLADSRIEYFGEGVLADKQRQGWLSRLLDNIWPF